MLLSLDYYFGWQIYLHIRKTFLTLLPSVRERNSSRPQAKYVRLAA